MLIFAIHTVFIARENILFLEEWIDYHIELGFSKFYLYDNSEVTKGGGFHIKHQCFVPGKVNKYGINYNELVKLTDFEIEQLLNKICEKYKNSVYIIKWSPKDKDGNVLFNQKEANNDCLRKLKYYNIHWCANIDMDEYIVLGKHKTIYEYIGEINRDVTCIRLSQVRFEDRFCNLEKLVIEIDKSESTDLHVTHSCKNIFKVNSTTFLNIHTWKGIGKIKETNLKDIWFNHYKLKDMLDFRIIKNINTNIVDIMKSKSLNNIIKKA